MTPPPHQLLSATTIFSRSCNGSTRGHRKERARQKFRYEHFQSHAPRRQARQRGTTHARSLTTGWTDRLLTDLDPSLIARDKLRGLPWNNAVGRGLCESRDTRIHILVSARLRLPPRDGLRAATRTAQPPARLTHRVSPLRRPPPAVRWGAGRPTRPACGAAASGMLKTCLGSAAAQHGYARVYTSSLGEGCEGLDLRGGAGLPAAGGTRGPPT
jgi:hypothetical protein